MIEFKPHHTQNNKGINFDLLINGKKYEFPKIKGNLDLNNFRTYQLTLNSEDAIKEFISHSFQDIPYHTDYLSLNFYPSYGFELDFLTSIWISQKMHRQVQSSRRDGLTLSKTYQDNFEISFQFHPDLTRWTKEYSWLAYYASYSKLVKQFPKKTLVSGLRNPNESLMEGFFVDFFEDRLDIPIEAVIEDKLKILRNIHKSTENLIKKKNDQNSITVSLDVPENLRVPYSQYLFYFSDFLKDIGPKIDSEIQNEAGKILFTITPEKSDEALDKIRAALEVYLQLPAKDLNTGNDNSMQIEVLKLNANVQHLKSQLSLAEAQQQASAATIEAKDVTIDVLKYTVAQQRQLLQGDISLAMRNITPVKDKPSGKEPLIKDLIDITTLDKYGVSVNLPELLRKLKKLFQKDE